MMNLARLGRTMRWLDERAWVGMERRQLYPAWLRPLVIVLLVGLGLNAAPVPESPGRWVPNPRQAVIEESDWILHYLVLQPRVGDRIPDALFVALAENENGWAAEYLARQRQALDRAASRLPRSDATAWSVINADLAVLDHDQAIVDHAGTRPVDPFALHLADRRAIRLRRRAEDLVRTLERQGNVGIGQSSTAFWADQSRRSTTR